MERARHEGVVLHRVAEHHQLGAAETAPIGGAFGRLLDGAAHGGHRVHVDARTGGAYVHGRTDVIGDGQRFGDGGHQLPVGGRGPLLYQSGKAADKIDAGRLGRIVHGHGKGHIALTLGGAGDQRHGCDRNALVDDGDAELPLDGLAGRHQPVRLPGDLLVDLPAGGLGVGIGAVQQGDAHRNGTDIQMLLVDHMDGL